MGERQYHDRVGGREENGAELEVCFKKLLESDSNIENLITYISPILNLSLSIL